MEKETSSHTKSVSTDTGCPKKCTSYESNNSESEGIGVEYRDRS